MKKFFTLLLVLCAYAVHAQNFDPRNLVVIRVGNGSPLGTGTSPLDLFEISPTTANQTPAPATAIPLAGVTALGNPGASGQITRTADGNYLIVMGYNQAGGVLNATALAGNKIIARIAADKTINTTTNFPTLVAANGIASLDGTQFWMNAATQASGTNANYEGYATFGQTTTPAFVAANGPTRVGGIYANQLFSLRASDYIYAYNLTSNLTNGLPTSSNIPVSGTAGTATATTTTAVSLSPTLNANGFVFYDLDPAISWNGTGLDVVYVTNGSSGLEKYYWNGNDWKPVNSQYNYKATIISGGSGYSVPPTVTIGKGAWATGQTYSVGDYVTFVSGATRRSYNVITAGTSGTAAPTHVTGGAAWVSNTSYANNTVISANGKYYTFTCNPSPGNGGTVAPSHSTGAVAATSGTNSASYTYNSTSSGTAVYSCYGSSAITATAVLTGDAVSDVVISQGHLPNPAPPCTFSAPTSGSTATATGSLPMNHVSNSDFTGLAYLTGTLNAAGNPVLYATTGGGSASSNKIVSIADNSGSISATMTSSNIVSVKLTADAATNYKYTGVALAPGIATATTTGGNFGTTGSWDVGYVPQNCNIVVSSGELVIDVNAIVGSVTINPGAKLTLSNGKTLTVSGNFTINSDATNGTGTFKNENASGGLTVSGTTTVNQSLQHASALRTWYVSSPVVSATPSPALSVIKSFDETLNDPTPANNWVSSSTMVAKKGYQVVPALAANDIAFTGTLNNGDQNIALTNRGGTDNFAGFNLIGNPYPSYLDWVEVMANSANVTLLRSTTMWYRTKDTGYTFWTVNGAGVSSPTGKSAKIPPMQAFWVRANAVGNLALTNAMRSHAPVTDKLLKAPAVKNTANLILRLQVSNGTNTDEAVIYTSDINSNGLDAYDSPKMSNENAAISEIFTKVDDEHLVINAMNAIVLDRPISLGFVPGSATSFSIKANEISNLPADVKVILKDNVTATETDLTDGISSYTFSPAETSGNRFSVIFRTANGTTDVANPGNDNIVVYCNRNNQIVIESKAAQQEGAKVAVYNSVGQKLVSKQLTTSSTVLVDKFNSGVYFVRINSQTFKVIIK